MSARDGADGTKDRRSGRIYALLLLGACAGAACLAGWLMQNAVSGMSVVV